MCKSKIIVIDIKFILLNKPKYQLWSSFPAKESDYMKHRLFGQNIDHLLKDAHFLSLSHSPQSLQPTICFYPQRLVRVGHLKNRKKFIDNHFNRPNIWFQLTVFMPEWYHVGSVRNTPRSRDWNKSNLYHWKIPGLRGPKI